MSSSSSADQPGPALKSFINASAGAVGALVTATVLYPIDLSKTQIQSGRSKEGLVQTLLSILRAEGAAGLFKGLSPKAVQSVAQNFIYFYAYAYYQSMHASLGFRSSYLSNTALGCAAGVTNLVFTLPLDTLVVQVQCQPKAEGVEQKSPLQLARELLDAGPSAMWRGFGISSVLTLNPAITNAIFDGLKDRYLEVLTKAKKKRVRNLTPAQGFLIGSLAKVVATLVTYPLICAKVTQQSRTARAARSGDGDGGSVGTVTEILQEILREQGPAGWYRGCSTQIGSAVTKSGIMLAAKEQLFRYTMSLILLARRSKAAALPVAASA